MNQSQSTNTPNQFPIQHDSTLIASTPISHQSKRKTVPKKDTILKALLNQQFLFVLQILLITLTIYLLWHSFKAWINLFASTTILSDFHEKRLELALQLESFFPHVQLSILTHPIRFIRYIIISILTQIIGFVLNITQVPLPFLLYQIGTGLCLIITTIVITVRHMYYQAVTKHHSNSKRSLHLRKNLAQLTKTIRNQINNQKQFLQLNRLTPHKYEATTTLKNIVKQYLQTQSTDNLLPFGLEEYVDTSLDDPSMKSVFSPKPKSFTTTLLTSTPSSTQLHTSPSTLKRTMSRANGNESYYNKRNNNINNNNNNNANASLARVGSGHGANVQFEEDDEIYQYDYDDDDDGFDSDYTDDEYSEEEEEEDDTNPITQQQDVQQLTLNTSAVASISGQNQFEMKNSTQNNQGNNNNNDPDNQSVTADTIAQFLDGTFLQTMSNLDQNGEFQQLIDESEKTYNTEIAKLALNDTTTGQNHNGMNGLASPSVLSTTSTTPLPFPVSTPIANIPTTTTQTTSSSSSFKTHQKLKQLKQNLMDYKTLFHAYQLLKIVHFNRIHRTQHDRTCPVHIYSKCYTGSVYLLDKLAERMNAKVKIQQIFLTLYKQQLKLQHDKQQLSTKSISPLQLELTISDSKTTSSTTSPPIIIIPSSHTPPQLIQPFLDSLLPPFSRQHPIFYEQVRNVMELVAIKNGEKLFVHDTPANYLYLLLEGEVYGFVSGFCVRHYLKGDAVGIEAIRFDIDECDNNNDHSNNNTNDMNDEKQNATKYLQTAVVGGSKQNLFHDQTNQNTPHLTPNPSFHSTTSSPTSLYTSTPTNSHQHSNSSRSLFKLESIHPNGSEMTIPLDEYSILIRLRFSDWQRLLCQNPSIALSASCGILSRVAHNTRLFLHQLLPQPYYNLNIGITRNVLKQTALTQILSQLLQTTNQHNANNSSTSKYQLYQQFATIQNIPNFPFQLIRLKPGSILDTSSNLISAYPIDNISRHHQLFQHQIQPIDFFTKQKFDGDNYSITNVSSPWLIDVIARSSICRQGFVVLQGNPIVHLHSFQQHHQSQLSTLNENFMNYDDNNMSFNTAFNSTHTTLSTQQQTPFPSPTQHNSTTPLTSILSPDEAMNATLDGSLNIELLNEKCEYDNIPLNYYTHLHSHLQQQQQYTNNTLEPMAGVTNTLNKRVLTSVSSMFVQQGDLINGQALMCSRPGDIVGIGNIPNQPIDLSTTSTSTNSNDDQDVILLVLSRHDLDVYLRNNEYDLTQASKYQQFQQSQQLLQDQVDAFQLNTNQNNNNKGDTTSDEVLINTIQESPIQTTNDEQLSSSPKMNLSSLDQRPSSSSSSISTTSSTLSSPLKQHLSQQSPRHTSSHFKATQPKTIYDTIRDQVFAQSIFKIYSHDTQLLLVYTRLGLRSVFKPSDNVLLFSSADTPFTGELCMIVSGKCLLTTQKLSQQHKLMSQGNVNPETSTTGLKPNPPDHEIVVCNCHNNGTNVHIEELHKLIHFQQKGRLETITQQLSNTNSITSKRFTSSSSSTSSNSSLMSPLSTAVPSSPYQSSISHQHDSTQLSTSQSTLSTSSQQSQSSQQHASGNMNLHQQQPSANIPICPTTASSTSHVGLDLTSNDPITSQTMHTQGTIIPNPQEFDFQKTPIYGEEQSPFRVTTTPTSIETTVFQTKVGVGEVVGTFDVVNAALTLVQQSGGNSNCIKQSIREDLNQYFIATRSLRGRCIDPTEERLRLLQLEKLTPKCFHSVLNTNVQSLYSSLQLNSIHDTEVIAMSVTSLLLLANEHQQALYSLSHSILSLTQQLKPQTQQHQHSTGHAASVQPLIQPMDYSIPTKTAQIITIFDGNDREHSDYALQHVNNLDNNYNCFNPEILRPFQIHNGDNQLQQIQVSENQDDNTKPSSSTPQFPMYNNNEPIRVYSPFSIVSQQISTSLGKHQSSIVITNDDVYSLFGYYSYRHRFDQVVSVAIPHNILTKTLNSMKLTTMEQHIQLFTQHMSLYNINYRKLQHNLRLLLFNRKLHTNSNEIKSYRLGLAFNIIETFCDIIICPIEQPSFANVSYTDALNVKMQSLSNLYKNDSHNNHFSTTPHTINNDDQQQSNTRDNITPNRDRENTTPLLQSQQQQPQHHKNSYLYSHDLLLDTISDLQSPLHAHSLRASSSSSSSSQSNNSFTIPKFIPIRPHGQFRQQQQQQQQQQQSSHPLSPPSQQSTSSTTTASRLVFDSWAIRNSESIIIVQQSLQCQNIGWCPFHQKKHATHYSTSSISSPSTLSTSTIVETSPHTIDPELKQYIYPTESIHSQLCDEYLGLVPLERKHILNHFKEQIQLQHKLGIKNPQHKFEPYTGPTISTNPLPIYSCISPAQQYVPPEPIVKITDYEHSLLWTPSTSFKIQQQQHALSFQGSSTTNTSTSIINPLLYTHRFLGRPVRTCLFLYHAPCVQQPLYSRKFLSAGPRRCDLIVHARLKIAANYQLQLSSNTHHNSNTMQSKDASKPSSDDIDTTNHDDQSTIGGLRHDYMYTTYEIEQCDLDRLSRRVIGNNIAFVAGGGGARGLSHLGVILNMLKNRLIPDSIVGTSQGAWVAGIFASAHPSLYFKPELYEKTSLPLNNLNIVETYTNVDNKITLAPMFYRVVSFCQAMSQLSTLLSDFNILPILSYFSGQNFNNLVTCAMGVYGDILHVDDTWLEIAQTATNISRANLLINRNGPLWQSTRASMSIIGLLPPIHHPKTLDLTLDGGYIANTPSDIAISLWNPKYIIAGDVENKDESHLQNIPPVGTSYITGGKLMLLKLYRTLIPTMDPKKYTFPTFNEMCTSLFFISHGRRQHVCGKDIDCYIRPLVQQYKLLDYDKLPLIVQCGIDRSNDEFDIFFRTRILIDLAKLHYVRCGQRYTKI